MFITSYSNTFQRKCRNCYCIYSTAIWIKSFGKLRILSITPNLILISLFSKVFLETNQQKIKNFPFSIEIVWDKNILFLKTKKISNDKKPLKNSLSLWKYNQLLFPNKKIKCPFRISLHFIKMIFKTIFKARMKTIRIKSNQHDFKIFIHRNHSTKPLLSKWYRVPKISNKKIK